MDEIVADAIRLLVDVMKKRGDYVKGSRVDGAIRLLECELAGEGMPPRLPACGRDREDFHADDAVGFVGYREDGPFDD